MHVDFAFRPDEGLPASALEAIRAEGPVVWSDTLGGWVVSSYDAVKTVLGETARFTSEGTPVQEAFGREAMLVTDTSLHHTMRGVWAKQVAPQAMRERAEALEGFARRSLEPLAERLRAGETTNIMETFLDFVTDVIAWMFEVPQSGIADLKRWNLMLSNAPALGGAEDSPEQLAHMRAKTEVYEYLRQVMQDRRDRAAAGEQLHDLISLMVAAEGRGGITRDMAADNLLNFFLGALDTTMKWLGHIVVFLDRRPDVREAVRLRRDLLPQVMEEVMRLETVAQSLMRIVREDTELAGVRLRAGDQLYVLLGAANRETAVFDDPSAFRLDREAKAHLGFGHGLHNCLGAATARQETLSFLNVLLDVLPCLQVAGVDYGDTWALWGPRRLEVRLP
jgi:cytochrome P450